MHPSLPALASFVNPPPHLAQHFNWEDFHADRTIPPEAVSASSELAGCTYQELLLRLTRLASSEGLLVLLACSRIRREYKQQGEGGAEWPGSWDGMWYEPPDFTEAKIGEMVSCSSPPLLSMRP